jgi:hypothetical protein
LIREVADKAPDEWTARFAIDQLASYLIVTMQNLFGKGITPARESILDALETLGLALQGKWGRLEGEITFILYALSYERSKFEQAVQGQIPARVAEQVIDGLVSVLALRTVSDHEISSER